MLLCLAAGGPLVLAPLQGTLRSLATASFSGGAALELRPLAACLLQTLGLLLLLALGGVALAAALRRRLDEAAAAAAGDMLALVAFALAALGLLPVLRALVATAGIPDAAVLARAGQALLWLAAGAACARAALRARAPAP